MGALPLIKTPADIATAMPRWKSELDPLLAAPVAGARLLEGVVLTMGANVINHGLGAKLRGYWVILNSASAAFYDSQSTNPTASLTLILNASAPTTVSLLVF